MRAVVSPEAPANGLILDQVQNRLASIPDAGRVELDLVWEPRWTPHRISPEGRRQLGL